LTKDSPDITGLPMDTLYMAKIEVLKADMCELHLMERVIGLRIL
jgi:hypothetical protein